MKRIEATHLTTRVLGALAAAAVLAVVAPTNLRAGDDSTTTKHTQHHTPAQIRHARHVHYVSDPQHEAPVVIPARAIKKNTDDAPLDESLYRSFQERNMLNPG